MNSSCEVCPEGSEHNEFMYQGCAPCQAGTFYKNQQQKCEVCEKDEICPVASAVPFPLTLAKDFSKISHFNDPPLY